MVPNRERSGIVLTAGKAGEKNERKALAAHYTPEGMVVEMVRPLVGVLFRDAWAQSEDDTKIYRDRPLGLRIVDPAMGSAHFLTVVALEIAKGNRLGRGVRQAAARGALRVSREPRALGQRVAGSPRGAQEAHARVPARGRAPLLL